VAGPADEELQRSLEEALAHHRAALVERFGGSGAGVRCFWSPGRVNLMGAHLDYSGGPVLPTSIDRGTFVAVRPRSDGRVELASTLEPHAAGHALDALPDARRGSWCDYPLGVLRWLVDRRREAGREVPATGLDVLFGGDLPVGAGLSSSASICVGTAFAVGQALALELQERDHLDAALWAERSFVGVQCGIMDPYAVRLTRPGHLLWVDCKDESYAHIPLDTERVRIVVADSGVRRGLAASEVNKRVAQCAAAFERLGPYVEGATCLRDVPQPIVQEHLGELSAVVGRRALHVAQEVERTFSARGALERGDLVGFGRCITAAHRSLRDLYEVSTPELDALVDAAAGWEGCYGTRLTGAGFGGCIVALVDADALEGFAEHLERTFETRFDARPTVAVFRGAGGPRELMV